MRSSARALVAIALLVPSAARAACNLIPSARQTFRSTLGSTDRPFAAPGDFVRLSVNPSGCDVASTGFLPTSAENNVTLVFTPPNGGQRRVVFLTAAACTDHDVETLQRRCEGATGVGAGRVTCVGGQTSLPSFTFPDTDAILGSPTDHRTLAGPVTIAVTKAADPLPCALATQPCTGQPGLLACIDDFYRADGTCGRDVDPVFSHFTALPPPNDFQAICFAGDPPCNGDANEARVAVDAGGNLLLPVNWQGTLVTQGGEPVPRLMRATIKSPLPFSLPGKALLASFTPEGARLPPIFEPESDPSITDPDVVTLFGTADAPYTILRIARRNGRCAGGSAAGEPCELDVDCPGSTCPTTCVGGPFADVACASDAECGGARCGNLYVDFSPATTGGGSLIVPRQSLGAGICEQPPHPSCASDADCPVGDRCVTYAFEARTPMLLESIRGGTPRLLDPIVSEAADNADHDGDIDTTDDVVTLIDRRTGLQQPLGAPPAACGIMGTPDGRAVSATRIGHLRFSALHEDDDTIAFLESEGATNLPAAPYLGCDENADGDAADGILRVFQLGLTTPLERTGSTNVAADGAPLVNRRPVTVSDGRVFFRQAEAQGADSRTTLESKSGAGVAGNAASTTVSLSEDARYVAFRSAATNLLPGGTPGGDEAFVRDRNGPSVAVLRGCDCFELGCTCSYPSTPGDRPAISANGAVVAASIAVPDNPSLLEAFTPAGTPVALLSVPLSDPSPDGDSDQAALSATGRFVAFRSAATNLVADDTNGTRDIFLLDRDVDENGTFDEPGGIEMTLARDFFGDFGADCARPAISADGQHVAFESPTQVYVYDHANAEFVVISDPDPGKDDIADGDASWPGISANGQYVVYQSNSTNLVTGDTNGKIDVFVQDRDADGTGIFDQYDVVGDGSFNDVGRIKTIRVSVDSAGNEANGDSVHPAISADGRWVVFESVASNLVPGDGNGRADVFVHDLATGTTSRLSTGPGGVESDGDSAAPAVSGDGSIVAFQSLATTLVAGTGPHSDILLREPDPLDTAADLTGDGRLRDTVLSVLDVAGGPPATPLCPASMVSVADGVTAFLRPESSFPTTAAKLPLCPIGADLDGDGNADDEVVHLWRGSGTVQNLRCPASAVAVSSSIVAAIVDGVVKIYDLADPVPSSCADWTDTGQYADSITVSGSLVAMLTAEVDQGQDLNGDGTTGNLTDFFDGDDEYRVRVLQLYDASTGGPVVNTAQAADRVVIGPTAVAFDTYEPAQGPDVDLNADESSNSNILQVYDTARAECMQPVHPVDCVRSTAIAVRPCLSQRCDPRVPYEISARAVKYLSHECDDFIDSFPLVGPVECDGLGADLDGNGIVGDTVIQVFYLQTGQSKLVGLADENNPRNPLDQGTVDVSLDGITTDVGRCIATLDATCTTTSDCTPGAFCEAGVCKRDQGVCRTVADCPPGVPCEPRTIVPASGDRDADGVLDHVDNCITTVNPDQTDADQDGVGDACDLAVCGNAVVDPGENCDGATAPDCPDACRADCTCCPNIMPDPKLRILAVTKRDAGILRVRATLAPFTPYTGQIVELRLDDRDSAPIVRQGLVLPPLGNSGVKWQMRTRAPGLQKVLLRDVSARKGTPPGTLFQLRVKARDWFSAAAANDFAANTFFTVKVGDVCFTTPVTQKRD